MDFTSNGIGPGAFGQDATEHAYNVVVMITENNGKDDPTCKRK